MKKFITILTIIFAIGSLFLSAFSISAENNNMGENGKKYKVYILQFVKHPALDETTRGIIEGLRNRGYINGQNLELQIEFAQGQIGIAAQIAQKFVSTKPDVVVGISTLSAQSLYKYAKEGKTKLIFSSVTDPVAAQLVNTLNAPGNNSSGVSNYINIEPQIEMFKKIMPNMKKLGFIYNPGELNSLSLISILEETCPKYRIELILQTANKSSDIKQSITNLISKVDAIFISNDNTALSAIKTIINVATEFKKPVFVSDTDIVEQGAIAALGPSQYDVGDKSAQMIDSVLQGKDINNIPVIFPENARLYININTAKKININFTDEILNSAAKLIQ